MARLFLIALALCVAGVHARELNAVMPDCSGLAVSDPLCTKCTWHKPSSKGKSILRCAACVAGKALIAGVCGDCPATYIAVNSACVCPAGTSDKNDGLGCTCDSTCGNGVVECDEACDDGVDGSATCTSACTVVPPCQSTCGNGVVECDEACDDGVDGSATCSPTCTTIA